MSPQRIFTLVALLLVVTIFIVAASRSRQAEPNALRLNPDVITHTKAWKSSAQSAAAENSI